MCVHMFSHPTRIKYGIQNLKVKLFDVVGLWNFPDCYPVPRGMDDVRENTIKVQQVSEKLEKGQKSIEWGLIKINGKQFTRERLNLKENKRVNARKL